MGYDRQYLFWALIYVICGMSLGIVMAAAHDDIEYMSLSHMLLVGIVLSLVFGVIHRLWLTTLHSFNALPSVMYLLLQIRQAGALTMFSAWLLLYGELFLDDRTAPALASVSITVLIAAMTMLYMVRNVAPERA